jgi:chromosome segregation ATPase
MDHRLSLAVNGQSAQDYKQLIEMKTQATVKYLDMLNTLPQEALVVMKERNKTTQEMLGVTAKIQVKINELTQTIREKEVFFRDYDSVVAVQEKDLKETKKKISSCNTTLEGYRKAIAEAEAELSVLTEREQAIQTDFDKKKDEKENSEQVLSDLKRQLEKLTAEKDEAEEKVADAVNDMTPDEANICAQKCAEEILRSYAILKLMENKKKNGGAAAAAATERSHAKKQKRVED